MGKARIISNIGEGLYLAEVLYDTTRADARLRKIAEDRAEISTQRTAIDAAISDGELLKSKLLFGLDAAMIAAPEGGIAGQSETFSKIIALTGEIEHLEAEKRMLAARDAGLDSEGAWIESAKPVGAYIFAIWCADYSLKIETDAIVGTAEVPGVFTPSGRTRMPIIVPAYTDEEYTSGLAVYDGDRDGLLFPLVNLGPVQSFFNLALYPLWAVWRQAWRVGEIQSIDYDANTCTIRVYPEAYRQPGTTWANPAPGMIPINKGVPRLEEMPVESPPGSGKWGVQIIERAVSPAAHVWRNVRVEYMECDSEAFGVGDSVLVRFARDGGDFARPLVVGFEHDPQPCRVRGLCSIPVNAGAPYGWGLPVTEALPLGTPLTTNVSWDYASTTAGNIFEPVGQDVVFKSTKAGLVADRHNQYSWGHAVWHGANRETVSWMGPRIWKNVTSLRVDIGRHINASPYFNFGIYAYWRGDAYYACGPGEIVIGAALARDAAGQRWLLSVGYQDLVSGQPARLRFYRKAVPNPVGMLEPPELFHTYLVPPSGSNPQAAMNYAKFSASGKHMALTCGPSDGRAVVEFAIDEAFSAVISETHTLHYSVTEIESVTEGHVWRRYGDAVIGYTWSDADFPEKDLIISAVSGEDSSYKLFNFFSNTNLGMPADWYYSVHPSYFYENFCSFLNYTEGDTLPKEFNGTYVDWYNYIRDREIRLILDVYYQGEDLKIDYIITRSRIRKWCPFVSRGDLYAPGDPPSPYPGMPAHFPGVYIFPCFERLVTKRVQRADGTTEELDYYTARAETQFDKWLYMGTDGTGTEIYALFLKVDHSCEQRNASGYSYSGPYIINAGHIFYGVAPYFDWPVSNINETPSGAFAAEMAFPDGEYYIGRAIKAPSAQTLHLWDGLNGNYISDGRAVPGVLGNFYFQPDPLGYYKAPIENQGKFQSAFTISLGAKSVYPATIPDGLEIGGAPIHYISEVEYAADISGACMLSCVLTASRPIGGPYYSERVTLLSTGEDPRAVAQNAGDGAKFMLVGAV